MLQKQGIPAENWNGIFAADSAGFGDDDKEDVDQRQGTANGNHGKRNILTCRNPFKIDSSLINYELDSEDEWAEENGEDL